MSPQELLAEAERAAAAPYIDYPPTPRWYAPAVGLWAAAGLLLWATDHLVVSIVGFVLWAVVLGAFLGWYRRYRGTTPTLRGAPTEITQAYRRYFVGVAVVFGIVVAVFRFVGPWPTAVAVLILVSAGLAWYERDYARAACAARARVGRR